MTRNTVKQLCFRMVKLCSFFEPQFYALNFSDKQQSNHYPESYIDEVFSDIFDDNGKGNKPGKGLSYEPRNKMITPEKKPALPVPYYKEDKRDNDSDKDKKLRKVQICVFSNAYDNY